MAPSPRSVLGASVAGASVVIGAMGDEVGIDVGNEVGIEVGDEVGSVVGDGVGAVVGWSGLTQQ